MSERTRNGALQGPVTDVEPDFLHQLPMDNAVGAIVALTAEVWLLRERLAALEAELTARRVLPDGAVENHEDEPARAAARAEELANSLHALKKVIIDDGHSRHQRQRLIKVCIKALLLAVNDAPSQAVLEWQSR